MDHKVEFAKITASTAFAFLLQQIELNLTYKFLLILIVAMMFDTVLGWACAFKKKQWQSSKARWGMIGKIFELGFIALACLISWALLPAGNTLERIFIVYFTIVELASIIENLFLLDVPLPKEFVGLSKKGKLFFGYFIVKKTQEMIEMATKIKFDDIPQDKKNENKQDESTDDNSK